MRTIAVLALTTVLTAFSIGQAAGAVVRHRLLPITPVVQRTSTSCWLAVAEMILRYFSVPVDQVDAPYVHDMDSQCTIYVVTFAPADHRCATNTENVVEVRSVMSQYAIALRATGKPAYTALNLTKTDEPTGTALDFSAIKSELDAARPVAIVLNVAGTAHVVLIVGFDDLGPAGQYITINDPFPYVATTNPWATFASSSPRPMQYTMTLSQLSAAAEWMDSLTGFTTAMSPKRSAVLDSRHPDVVVDAALEREYVPRGLPPGPLGQRRAVADRGAGVSAGITTLRRDVTLRRVMPLAAVPAGRLVRDARRERKRHGSRPLPGYICRITSARFPSCAGAGAE
jgi:hypothetical protein